MNKNPNLAPWAALVLLGLPLDAAPAGPAPPPLQTQTDARADYRALRNDFRDAERAFERELTRLEKQAGAEAAAVYRLEHDPVPRFAERAMERAANYAGTPAAFDFFVWVLQHEAGDPRDGYSAAAVEALATEHAEQREMGSLLESLISTRQVREAGLERTIAVLDLLADATEHHELAQGARFRKGRALLEAGTDAEQAAGRKLLEALREAEEGTPLGATIAGYLFERDHLQIGSLAPDIEAKDLDGVPFKLSDYRGKVVVLDFWGDW